MRAGACAALATLAPAAHGWERESWAAYVEKYIQKDGRVIDFAVAPGITTSEGQAYALLRAVWVDDRNVFERVLAWTDGNLEREGSVLPAWKWGALEDGGWGVVDANTASDADVILALSLFVASQKWNVHDYEGRAREIAKAIWEEEVDEIAGRWYLLPGRWARDYDPVPLNLSYYSPAFLRRLASLDPEHPWKALASTTYTLLDTALPVTGLPPDWMSVSRSDGTLSLGGIDGSLSGQFGHDAYRVYWNLAIDYVWDRTDEAKRYLAAQSWLARYLELNGTLPREVSPDAIPRISGPEPLALFGSLYPALLLFHRAAATQARTQLDAAYKDGLWGARADYYEQNIVWFGMALGAGKFPPFEPR